MQIHLVNGLLQTSMTISYRGQSLSIDNLVVDTGAAYSILSSDAVAEIGIKFENGDRLVRSFGIGGDEYSFRKRIDQLQLGDLVIQEINLDFGIFHGNIDINGLIGLDILKRGGMVIDLQRMQMYPAPPKNQ